MISNGILEPLVAVRGVWQPHTDALLTLILEWLTLMPGHIVVVPPIVVLCSAEVEKKRKYYTL